MKIDQSNVELIMTFFESDARKFGWGSLVNIVSFDALEGAHSILRNFTEVQLDEVKRKTRITWGDPTADFDDDLPANLVCEAIDPAANAPHIPRFYRRVRVGMIAKRIEGSLDEASMKTLKIKKREFSWTNPTTGAIELDGPTMLQIIIQGINPTTRVGVSDFKKSIQNCKLSMFDNNVKDMLDDMDANYQEIIAHSHTHDDYTMHLFDTLLTFKNEVFRSMVQRKKDDWELGGDIDPNALIDESVIKFNNMKKPNLWISSDSKDAKIIALTTKVETLQKEFASSMYDDGGKSTHKIDFHDAGDGWKKNVPEWKRTFKKASIVHEGKTYWWCKHHVYKDRYDGLYMDHKPEDHDECKANRKNEFNRGKDGDSSANGPDKKKLSLNKKMKLALMTKLKLSDSSGEELLASVN